MEVFLLLFDEIDDAVAVLRSLWPRLLGALLAVALMLATGFIFLRFPVPAIAVLLSATLLGSVRRRLLQDSPVRDP